MVENNCLKRRGKLVKVQHDPVTVSVEATKAKSTVRKAWEGVSLLMRRKSGDLPILILSFLEEGTFKADCQLIWYGFVTKFFRMILFSIARESLIDAFLCAPSSKKSAFFDVKKEERLC